MNDLNLTYEDALTELQQIVSTLEEDQLGMEKLAERVSRAGDLLQHCKEKLHGTEEKLDGILKTIN